MSEWTCDCGAVNTARACEVCGVDQPVAATPTVTPSESQTEALMRKPLCPHVDKPGEMCPSCRREVDRLRTEHKRKIFTMSERNERFKAQDARPIADVVSDLRATEGKG
jgi:hypothetical protein